MGARAGGGLRLRGSSTKFTLQQTIGLDKELVCATLAAESLRDVVSVDLAAVHVRLGLVSLCARLVLHIGKASGQPHLHIRCTSGCLPATVRQMRCRALAWRSMDTSALLTLPKWEKISCTCSLVTLRVSEPTDSLAGWGLGGRAACTAHSSELSPRRDLQVDMHS